MYAKVTRRSKGVPGLHAKAQERDNSRVERPEQLEESCPVYFYEKLAGARVHVHCCGAGCVVGNFR